MDQQQPIEVDKENDSCAANISKIINSSINSKPSEGSPSTPVHPMDNDDRQTDKVKKNDQSLRVLKNSTLGERFREQLKLLKDVSSDEDLVDDPNSSKISKNDAEFSSKKSDLKRPHIDKDKSSKSKKIKVTKKGNNGSIESQTVVTTAAGHSKTNEIIVKESEDQLGLMVPTHSADNNSQIETFPSTLIKRKKSSRKGKEKESNYDAILQVLTKIKDDVEWLKEHHTGLESFIVDNLTANSENWKQVKHTKPTSSDANLTIEDINRPPEVGYVRIDTNMIHLGYNVWLPKKSYDDAVYNATTNSMFVKNIAMALFGAQYLKEHSVKGKSCNKTKSKPRPAIDPTNALAVRDIF